MLDSLMSMKNFLQTLSLYFFILTVALMSVFSQALADLRVCNLTPNLLGVAIGYRAEEGWVTEGWFPIKGGGEACKTLIEGPLSGRYYYLYAEDEENGSHWEGKINMCIAEKSFKIAGINDCFTRGFQRAGFQEYDTREQLNWTIKLTYDTSLNNSNNHK